MTNRGDWQLFRPDPPGGRSQEFLHFSAILLSCEHPMWGRRFRLALSPANPTFYRRRLPHWHPDLDEASLLFVTWRLSVSSPQVRCRGWPATAPAPHPNGLAFLASDRQSDKAALGPVWLRDPRVASVAATPPLHGESGRHFYQLRAWVIMPTTYLCYCGPRSICR